MDIISENNAIDNSYETQINNNNFLTSFRNKFGVFYNTNLNKNILYLFVLLIVAIPFILCLSLSFILKSINNTSSYSIFSLLIVIGCYTTYLTILFTKYRNELRNHKLWIFFLYIPIGYVLLNIFGIIILLFFSFASEQTQNLVSIYSSYVLQIIMEIIIIAIFETKTKILSKSFKRVFNKKNIIALIILILVGVGLYFLLNFLLGMLNSLVGSGTSNNQANIESFSTSVSGSILVFVSAVLLAPIFEEIIYRYYFMAFNNYSWIGLLSSILMFAFAHVYQTGDFENILPYFSLGIVNGLIIYFGRNISPCILVHLVTNLIAFIIMMV